VTQDNTTKAKGEKATVVCGLAVGPPQDLVDRMATLQAAVPVLCTLESASVRRIELAELHIDLLMMISNRSVKSLGGNTSYEVDLLDREGGTGDEDLLFLAVHQRDRARQVGRVLCFHLHAESERKAVETWIGRP